MQRIGHPATRLIAAATVDAGDAKWAAAGVVAAVGPALWMWGFTVDDALISTRYALHLSLGLGWRFNAHGPSTDGVTPLPWPLLLASLGRLDPMGMLVAAKALGLVAWGATAAMLGAAIGRVRRAPWWGRAAALATLALSVPIAAYAVSGMETALATSLATGAAMAVRRPFRSAVLAGLAASLRPEMGAWACTLALGAALAAREPPRRVAAGVAVSLAPFVACAVVRTVVWGRPAPLAVMAKPSDFDHGLAYALAACVVTLAPLFAFAPMALRKSPAAVAIVGAALVHIAAIVAVGGDWMPYARLMVPVAPTLVYAGALACEYASPWATAMRSVLAVATGLILFGRGGTDGRRVGRDRTALVTLARPVLAGARSVAALDVGWVGAATQADIVDLAGLTDPEIAALPGGHTSKRVDGMFLLSRAPDALLLYAPIGLPEGNLERWTEAVYPRVVEARLVRDPVIARHFAPTDWLPLGPAGAGYVVLKARLVE